MRFSCSAVACRFRRVPWSNGHLSENLYVTTTTILIQKKKLIFRICDSFLTSMLPFSNFQALLKKIFFLKFLVFLSGRLTRELF
jgi:hypothetical protein